MKKFMSLVLALVMVMAMMVPAMAEEAKNGSITINDAIVGETYTIYQILDLESYNAETGAYAYKANSAWETWLKTQTTYVSFDAQGYVTWIAEESAAAEFAKAAQAYAKENGITNQGSVEAASETVSFTELDLGYYLVDTTLGALCSLDTTNPDVQMYEKNEVPSIKKEVQEDSDSSWGEKNTAQVGDTVNFKTTVTAHPGAQNYVVHDKMSEGLTLKADTIKIEGLTEGTDYTVKTAELGDDCDFHIEFTKDYLDTINAKTDIVITYSAVLNEQAVISTDANTNETKLDYGDDSETQWDKTETFAFKFELVKTDSKDKLLEGAKFELYDALTGGNKIALVEESEGVYRVATEEEKAVADFTSAVIEGSRATVEGLDANTIYYLEEIEAPAGYNKLPARVEVKIEETNLEAVVTDGAWVSGGVHVINQTGNELPSTGGMGTTMMYIGGGLLVAFAVIMLATKRRMNAAE